MLQKRFWEIDFLRGTSILLVILIHCTVYFHSDPVAKTIWNLSQLSVPVFIFCSLYIYFAKEWDKQEPFGKYFLKRSKRLLIPYFIFMPCFFLLLFFINPIILDSKFIIQSLIVTGGIEINWLILLFLQLTVILSLLKSIKQKNLLLYPLLLAALLSTIYLVFFPLPTTLNHKLVMWLPWSLMLGFTYFFVRVQTRKAMLITAGVLSFLVYIALYLFLQSTGDSTIFRENKYPPNLFYLSFGLVSIVSFYLLAPLFKWSEKPITWLSNNSYQLYFIHYFFLIWLVSYKQLLQLPWWMFFGLILGVSLTTLNVLHAVPSLFRRGKS